MELQDLNTIQPSKPLALDGASNVRDLGSYKNENGKSLKKHQFLRCDSLHKLTESDRKILEEYGVAAVVDLRSSMEAEHAPCVWKESESVAYYSVPLLDQMNSSGFQGEFPKSMSELYIGLLEGNKKEFAKVFHIMSQYTEKCVAFNCTAGKDRTGVTAMLLLGLAGVSDQMIEADYAASEVYFGKNFLHQKEQMEMLKIEIPEYVLRSEPEQMRKTLEFLKEKYGTAKDYMREIGVSELEIQLLENKLVG